MARKLLFRIKCINKSSTHTTRLRKTLLTNILSCHPLIVREIKLCGQAYPVLNFHVNIKLLKVFVYVNSIFSLTKRFFIKFR